MIYLDTHVVIWLAAGDTDQLSRRAAATIGSDDLRISPMVRLELQFLDELNRLVMKPAEIVAALEKDLGLSVCDARFDAVIHTAMANAWTRDPFDRLITAQALLADAPLVTKDQVIRKHYKKAIW